jgi:hypothetical protein
MAKLLKIEKSDKPLKKWTATFKLDNDKEKKVNFGYNNKNDLNNDYTLHKDKERRERYRKRHAKDLKTNDPMRAGYLSYYILWGDSTSMKKNISSYKKEFDL